jgi:hypothetical protein
MWDDIDDAAQSSSVIRSSALAKSLLRPQLLIHI